MTERKPNKFSLNTETKIIHSKQIDISYTPKFMG